MNGDFYRTVPKTRRLQGALSRLLRNKSRFLSLLLAILGILYLMFDNKGIVKRVQLEVRQRELTEKIAEAQKETERLKEQLKLVEQDKKMIETLARERYGMAREGETVYRVKKD